MLLLLLSFFKYTSIWSVEMNGDVNTIGLIFWVQISITWVVAKFESASGRFRSLAIVVESEYATVLAVVVRIMNSSAILEFVANGASNIVNMIWLTIGAIFDADTPLHVTGAEITRVMGDKL